MSGGTVSYPRVAERRSPRTPCVDTYPVCAMVQSVLHAADITLPVKLVHAARGKAARAEPVAALYEAGRVRHAGLFAKLEDELCGLMRL